MGLLTHPRGGGGVVVVVGDRGLRPFGAGTCAADARKAAQRKGDNRLRCDQGERARAPSNHLWLLR